MEGKTFPDAGTCLWKQEKLGQGAGIYYAGVWQELVLDESDGLLDWAKSIIE